MSQGTYDKALRRRLQDTELQLALMQQQFDEFRRNPSAMHPAAEGATINLKVSDMHQQPVICTFIPALAIQSSFAAVLSRRGTSMKGWWT